MLPPFETTIKLDGVSGFQIGDRVSPLVDDGRLQAGRHPTKHTAAIVVREEVRAEMTERHHAARQDYLE
jgi:hypothetical protein